MCRLAGLRWREQQFRFSCSIRCLVPISLAVIGWQGLAHVWQNVCGPKELAVEQRVLVWWWRW